MAKYITPAVTPLNRDGTLDVEGAKTLYEHLIAGGVNGILILGSIGEFFALSMEIKKQLISLAVKQVAHRVPLIVGTADMQVENVLSLSKFALNEGADAVIVVPPYYFSLNGGSIETYYDMLASRINGKLYIYNFPDRTGYSIPVDVIACLAQKHLNIIGCKDTLSGMDHTRELIKAVKPLRPDFEVFSGFDDNFVHNILSGGDGCIGGMSNLVPELTSKWVQTVEEKNMESVSQIQQKIDRMMTIYSVGMPFVPYIKRAMEICGIGIQSYSTFPQPIVTAEADKKLLKILQSEGLV